VDDADIVEATLTDTAGVTLGDPLVLDAELVEDVVLVWESVEEIVVVDDDVDTVDDELVVSDPPFDPSPEAPLSSDNEHCFTSCTSGCPLTVTGVRVITQVSITTPEAVFCLDTVVNVTG